MIIPLRTDSPLGRTPWMNWSLIVLNVAIFAGQSTSLNFLPYYFDLDPLDPDLRHIYTYVTYAFLHGNWMHVLGNMLFLYIFGNNVNDRMGNLGYLLFYLGGAAFAGVGHVVTATAPVVGASGAVAAIVGAYLVLFPRSHITILYFFILIGTIEIPSVWFIVFFFVKDLLPALSGEESGIAHSAHVSGTLFGFIICVVLLGLHLLSRSQFDVLSLMQRWHRRRQYQDMVARGYDPFGHIPANRGAPMVVNPNAERIQDLRAAISEAIAAHNLAGAARLYADLKTIDPQQILSRQAQLDVANQLASEQNHAQAAEAYEMFLLQYPRSEQSEQVALMLGLIYARYLHQYERARTLLTGAVSQLHSEPQRELARSELSRIDAAIGPKAAG